MCFKPRNSFIAGPATQQLLSLLVLAVVTGVGQARHIEFDRIAAFVASGCKATKHKTTQAQNNTAHLSSPGLTRMRDASLPARAAPVKQILSMISKSLQHFGTLPIRS
jgi:hypothetical protein